MPSFSPPITLLILILSLHICISISQKAETFGSARRILASIEEEEDQEDQQPLSKPKKKPIFDSKSPKAEKTFGTKKSSALIEEQDHKKLTSNSNNQKADSFKEDESQRPIPKPKKKLASSSNPQEAETYGKKKSLSASEDEDEKQPLPKTKKKLTSSSNPQKADTFGTKWRSGSTEEEDEAQPIPKPKKKITFESKNQTNSINKAKKTNSTVSIPNSTIKTLDKTLKSTPKSSNFTKIPKQTKLNPNNSTKTQPKSTPNSTIKKPLSKPKLLILDQTFSWLEDDTDGQDLITEFRDFPSRLIPDLEKISTTSQAYLRKYNKEIEHGIRPFVGAKYAPTIASLSSFLFLILPLLLATLLFRHLKGYLSLQKFLIFIQAYLAIYFATLSLTAAVTGLEPLRFFYGSAPETYAWTQAVQTLGYVLYLIVQLINLVVVFTSPAGEFTSGARALGLAQMIVGLAVGLHYYVSVFHRAVMGEPPRANWKVHGIYAMCFLVICAFARAERRKKAYLLDDGGDYGKKS